MAGRDLTDAINRVVEGEEEAADHPEDIRIAIPKESEINPDVFKDVEHLLFRGFLTLYGEVGGVSFVFKSMNHHEYETLQFLSGGATLSGRSADKYYASFLAQGVFMVDGQNILPERAKWLPKLEETFAGLPTGARSKIVRYLSEVNRKASNAIALTEVYHLETTSRFRWAQFKGLDLMGVGCTGVQGTETLGMNFGQLVWRALNHYEDLKESIEQDWSHAKFIGGCFVGGKEMRKVHTQDTERRKKEKEERMERRDKVLRRVLLGVNPEEEEKQDRTVKIVARTVEELASQLERDLRGEKDWHDEVVAREEARIRDGIYQRQQKLKEMSEARDVESRLPYTSFTETAGLTGEEVKQRVLRKRQIEAQQAASTMVYPEMMDPRMSDFMQKYMDPEDSYQVPGSVQSNMGTTDRDTSEVRPLPPARPRATPFRR